MTKPSFDVAVVGAGPAGSTLAALLAGRGLSVALVDRDTFPRDKLCGEFLSYDALPLLERLDVDLTGCPEIRQCRIVARSRTLEFPLPHASRGVSRLLLDDLLFRNAVSRGARPFVGCTAAAVTQNGVDLGGELLDARAVAGAWGRWGRFDAQLGRRFVRDRAHRNFGFKRHYVRAEGASPRVDGTIELHSFGRGYLGVNQVENGLVNICGLVHASRLAGHRGRWESFVESLRDEQPDLEQLYAGFVPAQETFLSSDPVIFRARSPVEQGIFMAGDASGVIDPLTGNGMGMAIQSALLLAPLIVRLVEHPSDRAAVEREYRERHRAMFARRIGWSRAVARILSRPTLLDRALATFRSPRLGELFVRRTRADRDEIARLADAWFATS